MVPQIVKMKKTKKKPLFTDRAIITLAAKMIQREAASFAEVIKQDAPKHSIPTRQILVPDWGHSIKRGNLSLHNLIEWCEKQTDPKHQAITAWLVAARDMMDCATLAAIKQSQIDSRKKTR